MGNIKCQTGWMQNRSVILSDLICVQTVVNCYLQILAIKELMIYVIERGYYLLRMDHWSKIQGSSRELSSSDLGPELQCLLKVKEDLS